VAASQTPFLRTPDARYQTLPETDHDHTPPDGAQEDVISRDGYDACPRAPATLDLPKSLYAVGTF
jgi:hypothetical protein